MDFHEGPWERKKSSKAKKETSTWSCGAMDVSKKGILNMLIRGVLIRWVSFAVVFGIFPVACNNAVEQMDSVSEAPIGTISGYAIDSAIEGGTVAVYSFADGVRGEQLART